MEAKGQVARLNELYAEYQKYPLITKQRMFYETMEEILPDMKVIIEKSDGTTQTMLPLESFANLSETEKTGIGTERGKAAQRMEPHPPGRSRAGAPARPHPRLSGQDHRLR